MKESDASITRFPFCRSISAALRGYCHWITTAIILLGLPLVFRTGTALTMLSLMGIAIVFALSYNMLLGQTGMLSFGHAVYYGLGGYLAVHAMNAIATARAPVPLPIIPLIGGIAGLLFAMLFGWVSTKRSGTAFAMISLGLAELVGSSSLILRTFFGGEEGVTTDRTKLLRLFGWNFGTQIQVYYLIAAWCFISMAAIYAITCTPFGRICNAVRDNPGRVEFLGYNPQIVRFIAFCLSGIFAGIAGALAAINFEIANAAYFSAAQSGNVLLATFVGGTGYFIGPILGAVLITYLQVMLSDVTEVWQLYFGLMFIAAVMYAPGGLAGIIMMHLPFWRAGVLMRVLASYALIVVPGLATFAGLVLSVEMTARLTMKQAEGPAMKLFGISLAANDPIMWLLALALLGGGVLALSLAWLPVARAWDKASADASQKGYVV
jgi:branched-chain amino acid transport system permease protein